MQRFYFHNFICSGFVLLLISSPLCNRYSQTVDFSVIIMFELREKIDQLVMHQILTINYTGSNKLSIDHLLLRIYGIVMDGEISNK